MIIPKIRFYLGVFLRKFVVGHVDMPGEYRGFWGDTHKPTRKQIMSVRIHNLIYLLTRPIAWIAEVVAPEMTIGDDYDVLLVRLNMKPPLPESSINLGAEYVCDIGDINTVLSKATAAGHGRFVQQKSPNYIMEKEERAKTELYVNGARTTLGRLGLAPTKDSNRSTSNDPKQGCTRKSASPQDAAQDAPQVIKPII